jgi:hypothetical protein
MIHEYMDQRMRHNRWSNWNKARGKDVDTPHPPDRR